MIYQDNRGNQYQRLPSGQVVGYPRTMRAKKRELRQLRLAKRAARRAAKRGESE